MLSTACYYFLLRCCLLQCCALCDDHAIFRHTGEASAHRFVSVAIYARNMWTRHWRFDLFLHIGILYIRILENVVGQFPCLPYRVLRPCMVRTNHEYKCRTKLHECQVFRLGELALSSIKTRVDRRYLGQWFFSKCNSRLNLLCIKGKIDQCQMAKFSSSMVLLLKYDLNKKVKTCNNM